MHFGRPRRPAFTGAPDQYHRAARRMGAGWRPSQVARVLKCDQMDIHLLFREDAFAELYRAYLDLRALSPAERIQRLREVALLVLEEALEEKDPRVAWFVLRECELGHDPAETLARGIAAAAERDQRAARPYEEEPPPPAPPARPRAKSRPAASSGDRVAWRVAARMREAVMEEQAARREEPGPPLVCDEAMFARDLALIRRLGESRRSLPPDFLEIIAAEPDMPAEQKAYLRRLYMAMPEGP